MTDMDRQEHRHDDLFWPDADVEPITETDDELAAIVADADLPSLLAAIAAATGDASILTDDLLPPLTPVDTLGHPHGGMTPEQQARAREVAVDGLARLRDERIVRVGTLPDATADRILAFLAGGRVAWVPTMRHELDLVEVQLGAPTWRYADLAGDREFPVLVVGAGVSGIVAGHRLAQTGTPFTMIEVGDAVGGTWRKNTYPGVRLDTPTFGYSYSFAQRGDWPHQFAEGDEIRQYLEEVADRAGLVDRIEFGTALVRAVWNEAVTLPTAARADFLATTGRERVRELHSICAESARPWSGKVTAPTSARG